MSRNLGMRKLNIVLTFAILFGSSCFGPGHLRVSMKDDLPPRFMFDGPGRWSHCCSTFFEFAVMERTTDDPNPWDSHSNIDESPNLIWRIVPAQGYVEIREAPQISYGQVPNGWTQTHPKVGRPPELLEGRSYVAGQPHLSPEGTLLFKVINGKAVIVR
jgi:hypothetical protein